MSQPQKPREFWIDDRDNGDGYVVHEKKTTHVQGELIHVREVLPVSADRGSDSEKEFCKLIDCSVRMNRKHQFEAYEYLKALVESNPAPQEKAQGDGVGLAAANYWQKIRKNPNRSACDEADHFVAGAIWARNNSRPQSPSPAVVEAIAAGKAVLSIDDEYQADKRNMGFTGLYKFWKNEAAARKARLKSALALLEAEQGGGK